jgi:hypothetical protein
VNNPPPPPCKPLFIADIVNILKHNNPISFSFFFSVFCIVNEQRGKVAGSEVLTAVVKNVAIFFDIAPASPYANGCFGGTYHSTVLVHIRAIRRYVPEDGIIQNGKVIPVVNYLRTTTYRPVRSGGITPLFLTSARERN